jgi:hypothetical protein
MENDNEIKKETLYQFRFKIIQSRMDNDDMVVIPVDMAEKIELLAREAVTE